MYLVGVDLQSSVSEQCLVAAVATAALNASSRGWFHWKGIAKNIQDRSLKQGTCHNYDNFMAWIVSFTQEPKFPDISGSGREEKSTIQ